MPCGFWKPYAGSSARLWCHNWSACCPRGKRRQQSDGPSSFAEAEIPLLFICRLHSMAPLGIVIVHHHGINAQFDHIRLFDLQAPNEKLLQQTPEQENPGPGKRIEKAFHLVRRSHLFDIGLNGSSIALISGELVKIDQMPAGAVCHEAENLLKKFEYIRAFSAFAHRPEEPIQKAKNFNLMQICDKETQPGSSGQPVGSCLHGADFGFIFSVGFAILFHKVLHLLGVLLLLLLSLVLASIITHYPRV